MTDERNPFEYDESTSGAGEASEPPPGVPRVGELQELIDEMLVAVTEAKSVPLSGNVMVDREQMLAMLENLRERMPEEMRAARWMVRERETFVARTNERVRDLVTRARRKADALVSDSNIIAEATEEANILVRRAEDDGRRIRLEAEDYASDRLEKLEALLTNVLGQTRQVRSELHQVREVDQHVPGT
jgi:hypothetical protein